MNNSSNRRRQSSNQPSSVPIQANPNLNPLDQKEDYPFSSILCSDPQLGQTDESTDHNLNSMHNELNNDNPRRMNQFYNLRTNIKRTSKKRTSDEISSDDYSETHQVKRYRAIPRSLEDIQALYPSPGPTVSPISPDLPAYLEQFVIEPSHKVKDASTTSDIFRSDLVYRGLKIHPPRVYPICLRLKVPEEFIDPDVFNACIANYDDGLLLLTSDRGDCEFITGNDALRKYYIDPIERTIPFLSELSMGELLEMEEQIAEDFIKDLKNTLE